MQLQGKIPVTVSPVFFITAGLIGYLSTESLVGVFLWTFVIFFSVLVHELGHAVVAYFIGLRPRIELTAFGGITHHGGMNLSPIKQIGIALGGPLFGFILYLSSFFVLYLTEPRNDFLFELLYVFQWINLVWTIFNLLPVLPLDGGQVLRLLLEIICKKNGTKYALLSSAICALVFGVLFFFCSYYIVGLFFFFFAHQNYEGWRRISPFKDD